MAYTTGRRRSLGSPTRSSLITRSPSLGKFVLDAFFGRDCPSLSDTFSSAGISASHYREGVLGRGGMGVVYKAVDSQIDATSRLR